ncbi:unnamed protein product [Phytophthora lilii]|uniref:Unnamed protein product n=1 Tax=Phytophthora lilii TaxID=2077276 RepID=A0A9W6WQD4_9STRA|nr:unnamed protein product [Phytophthora lilii]
MSTQLDEVTLTCWGAMVLNDGRRHGQVLSQHAVFEVPNESTTSADMTRSIAALRSANCVASAVKSSSTQLSSAALVAARATTAASTANLVIPTEA